ncbi:cation:proton antiporter [Trichothermofontia sp.]
MTLTLTLLPPLTIAWITLPFFWGFLGYLLPKCDRYFAGGMALLSVAYALLLFWQPAPLELRLLDHFGVSLLLDSLTGFFVITNGLVTAAVVCYCWQGHKTPFFYAQMLMLHGSVNAAFACADLMSLYVALEVLGIAAFLLMAYPRSDRSIWVGLRYLFVSNTAMLFYLVGAILVYRANHSFAFTGLANAPAEALALLLVGLLTKGGIFLSGLWLPVTHAEAETPVSALLSGVVVKAGVFPLLRFTLLSETLDPLVRGFGVATALLGVSYALLEQDTKRVLALSTLSQMGWILAAPAVGGGYALAHGLAKSTSFLIAGNLPSRRFQALQQHPIAFPLWLGLVLASLSIAGCPPLLGFAAKTLTLKELLPWQGWLMNLGAIGTAIVMAKFILLPVQWPATPPSPAPASAEPSSRTPDRSLGFWVAIVLPLGSLLLAGWFNFDPALYGGGTLLKTGATLAIGGLIYALLVPRISWQFPRHWEQLEHLIGMMSVMLVALFWMVLA